MSDDQPTPAGDQEPPAPATRRHIQEVSGGQIGFLIAGDLNGSITYSAPQPSAAEQAELARRHLLARQYAPARAACAQALESEPENAHAHLLSAIATLNGSYADRLDVPTIQGVEASLEIAAGDPALAATAWAVLAIIAHDYDKNRGGRWLTRTFADTLAELKGADRTTIDTALLDRVRTLPATRRKILP